MLPTPTPDDAGMPAFWALAGTQTRRLTWGRARAPEAAETAAQKEQPASQPGSAKATKHRKKQRFVAGVARARAKRPQNQREKSKDRAAREPATAKAKRTEQAPLSREAVAQQDV